MTTLLSRWHRSRGFGVHSPFAFSFILDVLRERRYAYYAYDSIDDPWLRLWFRVVCRFQPATIHVDSPRPDALKRVALMASPHSRMVKGNASMRYVADGHRVGRVSRGEVVMVEQIAPDGLDRVFEAMDCGMCFTNRSGAAVIAGLEHLPHQRFDILF